MVSFLRHPVHEIQSVCNGKGKVRKVDRRSSRIQLSFILMYAQLFRNTSLNCAIVTPADKSLFNSSSNCTENCKYLVVLGSEIFNTDQLKYFSKREYPGNEVGISADRAL